jgi:phosphatidylserine decarboxylase
MTVRRRIARLAGHDGLNFLLTNRLPRRTATRFVGWLSRIEQPLVRDTTIALWRLFCDVDLSDAEKTRFSSMRDCFTRRLRPGARPFDPDPAVVASPCDAIVGASGEIVGDTVHQIKGMSYRLSELLGGEGAADPFVGGRFVTLRLTAGMYHRFHAPADLTVERVTYFPGDCWNVNPPTLKRVPRLFCRNERAVLSCRMADGTPLIIVAVAAVLVASLRLTFLDLPARIRRGASHAFPVNAAMAKGEEMGWFEQGSTLVVLLPPGSTPIASEGVRIRAGQPLARGRSAAPAAPSRGRPG